MAKKIYNRTPESNVTAQDDDLKAANIFEAPEITIDNLDDQRPNCIGFKSGVPHYHDGIEMIPFGSGVKQPIPTTGDFTISWQTDLVPGTNRKYVQIFGDHIFDVKGVWDDNGTMRPYTPDWTYTKIGNNIDTVILRAVFPGELTFN